MLGYVHVDEDGERNFPAAVRSADDDQLSARTMGAGNAFADEFGAALGAAFAFIGTPGRGINAISSSFISLRRCALRR